MEARKNARVRKQERRRECGLCLLCAEAKWDY